MSRRIWIASLDQAGGHPVPVRAIVSTPGTKKTKGPPALNASVEHEHITQGCPCSAETWRD